MMENFNFGIKDEQDRKLREFKKENDYIVKLYKKKRAVVEKNFPFTRNQNYYIHSYKRVCPNWVINLLYQYYILNEVPEVVRSFNNHR